MFDFFKEIYLEKSGIDIQKLKEEREEKKRKENESKYLFSKGMKIFTIILGIMYLLIAISEITVLINISGSIIYILKILFQSLIDVAIIVCLMLKKKKYEKVAIGLIVLFFIVGYMTIVLI